MLYCLYEKTFLDGNGSILYFNHHVESPSEDTKLNLRIR